MKIFGTRSGSSKGFTLIELLVVISIISLLSSIIFGGLNSARQKGKMAKLKLDMKEIITEIELARDKQNKTTLQITQNPAGCTICSFMNDGLPVKDSSHTAALATLSQLWQNIGFNTVPTDPWGNPYILDENEGEFGTSDCRNDWLFSAGPDGIVQTNFPVSGAVLLGDDYEQDIQTFFCPAQAPGYQLSPTGGNNVF